MTAQVGQDKAAQQRAIDKAQKLGGVKLVQHETVYGKPLFLVPSLSSSGILYAVSNEMVCNCPAGLRGIPCWHAASVWLWKMTFNLLPKPSEAAKRRHALLQRRHLFSKNLDETLDDLEAHRRKKNQAEAFRALLGG